MRVVPAMTHNPLVHGTGSLADLRRVLVCIREVREGTPSNSRRFVVTPNNCPEGHQLTGPSQVAPNGYEGVRFQGRKQLCGAVARVDAERAHDMPKRGIEMLVRDVPPNRRHAICMRKSRAFFVGRSTQSLGGR